MLKVVLYLSESLLQLKAVLLPTVCQAYGVSHSGIIASVELSLEVGNKPVTWALGALSTMVQNHYQVESPLTPQEASQEADSGFRVGTVFAC